MNGNVDDCQQLFCKRGTKNNAYDCLKVANQDEDKYC